MKTSLGQMIAVALTLVGVLIAPGCTDKGDGLMGSGPDDRVDRGGGPNTLEVYASMDTYYERSVDFGSRLLAGSIGSIGLETVTFLRFEDLPNPDGELSVVELLLFSDTEILSSDNYGVRVSLLEQAVPDTVPYWPGPPEGPEFVVVSNAATEKDTTSLGEDVHFLRVPLPADWIADWIADSSANYGLRISGTGLRLSQGGIVVPRFRSSGQVTEGSYDLSPRLETLKTDQTARQRWKATTSFFIFRPTIGPVGDSPSMQMGGIFGYRLLLRFPLPDSLLPAEGSVNKALLTLKVDVTQPDLNQGVFDAAARAVTGDWREDLTNLDVNVESATTPAVEVDAEDSTKVELDLTALVEVFGKGDFFDVTIFRTSSVPALERVVFFTSEAADTTNAPVLRLVYTTPPGGRFTP